MSFIFTDVFELSPVSFYVHNIKKLHLHGKHILIFCDIYYDRKYKNQDLREVCVFLPDLFKIPSMTQS